MPLNPYTPPNEPPLRPPIAPFPTWANTIHLTMIAALILAMILRVVTAPEHLIGILIFSGFFLVLPYICSLVGAMGSMLTRNHQFADQFRRYLALFLTGMILHDMMLIGIVLFTDN